jgi:hypothetical protein
MLILHWKIISKDIWGATQGVNEVENKKEKKEDVYGRGWISINYVYFIEQCMKDYEYCPNFAFIKI